MTDTSTTVRALTRLANITILGNIVRGITLADWIDNNPWVQIEIPSGPIIYQHLIGTRVDITIDFYDPKSLFECLFNTTIDGVHYPVASNNFTKYTFSTNGTQFSMCFRTNLGETITFNFFNVKVKQISMPRILTDGKTISPWKVTFFSDYYEMDFSQLLNE